ncbi:MAG: dihydrolipoyllysine-residue succinyltransferase [Verrucomicrobiales bacterium]|nr:dihydrolipoyllysine-residue succinyltransferase [Verrucomicrobiales bacterium]
MSFEIKIPPVGESITSGVVGEWHKADGEPVAKGDALLTLETDKVSTELAAEVSGVLRQRASEGDEVEIGAVVGVIEEGEVEVEEAATGAVVAEPKAEEPEVEVEQEPAANLSVVVPEVEERPMEVVEPGEAGRVSRKRMSPLRKKIATHLVNAQQTAAILTTFNEADMSGVMGLRKEVQEAFVAKHGVKLGFMSFFIKAVVQGLKDVPQVNSRIDGDEVVTNHFFDIGVAVGTEKGLIVPVLRDADQKGFAELEKEIGGFAEKARDGKIKIEELQGGVFTISNGGVYGSLLSTPILNPPQSGILGMLTLQQRPVAIDGKVEVRPMMYLALSYDHRVVDGKEAVTFLVRVKECLENPARLLVGV